MPSKIRWILSTVLASVVTPALAMLFDLVGSALQQGNLSSLTLSPDMPSPILTLMLPAIIFGAPFAIPIALAVRLRRTWMAVPFIALAAAFGIELQIQVGRHFEESSTVSEILMLVWIIPAIVGTVAALLLKWREQASSYSIAAIAATALIVFAIAGAERARELAPAYMAAETWSQLRVGVNVFTGDERNGSGQTVCPTLAMIISYQSPNQCRHIAVGTLAIVDAIIPCKRSDPSWGYESPHVRLHAADDSWGGFADAAMLQPDIPVGTPIEIARDWDAPIAINNDHGGQTILGDTALVKLLRYDPRREASLYVKVLDGPHRDKTGWTWVQSADTGGVALGEYSLQYPYRDCVKE
jgi:hypothetical protein